MLNPAMLCDEKEIFLLILIKSNVNHHRLRYVIRNTWAKEAYSVYESVRVAFLIGNSLEEGISMWIENFNFGDIIQGDFVDAYKNNTYKTIMAYRWVVEYCSNARFVFFIDDDMFVNVKLTKTFLNSVDKKTESNLFSGAVVNAGRPARETNNPWFVNKKDYPYKVYPEYLSGCAMFVSQSVIRRFNVLFPYVKYFPFDDVYLGIIANKLGIPLHNNKYLVNANINNVSALNSMIANHGFKNESYLLNTYGDFSVGDMLM
ncbi:hypothetical protein FSP39_003583 [Pinctada imbricata]|uniref:Hexosyltransferase n=1 Tax=Pinctada imbricata TaxID=66713 RepID=A0AA89C8C6_PINIB|nr:hypothetical protein FSP39_003583 [Pinctada imbricata]